MKRWIIETPKGPPGGIMIEADVMIIEDGVYNPRRGQERRLSFVMSVESGIRRVADFEPGGWLSVREVQEVDASYIVEPEPNELSDDEKAAIKYFEMVELVGGDVSVFLNRCGRDMERNQLLSLHWQMFNINEARRERERKENE